MKHNRILPLTSILIGIALLAGLFFPSGTVHAQSPDGDTGSSSSPARLERILLREQTVLTNLQTRLANTASVVDRLQDGIARAQTAGYDTTTLEDALAAYQQSVAAAQASAESAAALLAAPAGFDAAGLVTDAAAARATLREAGGDLRDALTTLRSARLTLRAVITTWRTDHPDLVIDEGTGS